MKMDALSAVAIALLLAAPEARMQGGPQPAAAPSWATRDLRAGIIGTDTSHVPQFTKMLNSRPGWRVKVVAAYKGGSPDLPLSATRVDKFAATIQQEHGVEFVDSIDALLKKVDVVLLTSVDGRTHLAQVTPVFKAGKRVFIDKPLAASIEDARRIVELSKQTGTPFFSASSVRFHSEIPKIRSTSIGKVAKVQASYVLNLLEFHPDLFFYGIHGVDALYAVMGRGCERLSRTITPEADVTSCRWKDGRTGVYHGMPEADPQRPLITVSGERGTLSTSRPSEGYEPLLLRIVEFFHTGRAPVDPAETLEVIEFMTAAQLSKERKGAEVALAELRK